MWLVDLGGVTLGGILDLFDDLHATPFLYRRQKTFFGCPSFVQQRLTEAKTPPEGLRAERSGDAQRAPAGQAGQNVGVTLPVLVVNGVTASGKTAVAVDVARRLQDTGTPAEVVNADSMLVYRGMDIGTAKPTLAERGGIVHHLIDIMDVTQTASVAVFQGLARAAIADCRARGVVPIVAGGSALYMRAILDHFAFPATDARVRGRLEAELAEVGPEALYERLRELAPQVAVGILPGNGRRVVRALEVIELTGSFTATLPEGSYEIDGVEQFGLALDRQVMDSRIEQRVDSMWDQGFVDEVRRLVPLGLREGKTASRALGYRQILQYLDGQWSQEEARAATVAGTRRFARKQLGWFRRDPRITWLAAGPDAAGEIVSVARCRLDRQSEEP